MYVLKDRKLLTATYDPRRTLTDMRILETTILKFQASISSFRKSEYDNLWDTEISSYAMKKAIENLSRMRFSIAEDNVENERIFNEITYQRGRVSFDFSERFLKYIALGVEND